MLLTLVYSFSTPTSISAPPNTLHWSRKTCLEKGLTLPFGKENKEGRNKDMA